MTCLTDLRTFSPSAGLIAYIRRRRFVRLLERGRRVEGRAAVAEEVVVLGDSFVVGGGGVEFDHRRLLVFGAQANQQLAARVDRLAHADEAMLDRAVAFLAGAVAGEAEDAVFERAREHRLWAMGQHEIG